MYVLSRVQRFCKFDSYSSFRRVFQPTIMCLVNVITYFLFMVKYIIHIAGPQRDRTTPKFSGMNFGDLMKVTVMEEMENLKMYRNEPMDLSNKPWNLSNKS